MPTRIASKTLTSNIIKKERLRKVVKWEDEEIKYMYVFLIFNFPYIFNKRFHYRELSIYGISAKLADAVMSSISEGRQVEQVPQNSRTLTGFKFKMDAIQSESEQSTEDFSLGKRSPIHYDYPLGSTHQES